MFKACGSVILGPNKITRRDVKNSPKMFTGFDRKCLQIFDRKCLQIFDRKCLSNIRPKIITEHSIQMFTELLTENVHRTFDRKWLPIIWPKMLPNIWPKMHTEHLTENVYRTLDLTCISNIWSNMFRKGIRSNVGNHRRSNCRKPCQMFKWWAECSANMFVLNFTDPKASKTTPCLSRHVRYNARWKCSWNGALTPLRKKISNNYRICRAFKNEVWVTFLLGKRSTSKNKTNFWWLRVDYMETRRWIDTNMPCLPNIFFSEIGNFSGEIFSVLLFF